MALGLARPEDCPGFAPATSLPFSGRQFGRALYEFNLEVGQRGDSQVGVRFANCGDDLWQSELIYLPK